MNQHQAIQLLLPLLIVAVVIALRARRLGQARPLRWRNLWVRPAIFVAIAAAALAGAPPAAADLPWLALAAAVGGVAGWHWGRTMMIEMHPENGTLTVKGGQAAILVMLVLVVLRLGLRTGLQMEAPAWHIRAVLVTDAFIVLSAVMFAMRGLEMFLRARKVMQAHAPSGAGQPE
jgi:hypothetical protein